MGRQDGVEGETETGQAMPPHGGTTFAQRSAAPLHSVPDAPDELAATRRPPCVAETWPPLLVCCGCQGNLTPATTVAGNGGEKATLLQGQ